jgi:hypothetical protein
MIPVSEPNIIAFANYSIFNFILYIVPIPASYCQCPELLLSYIAT